MESRQTGSEKLDLLVEPVSAVGRLTEFPLSRVCVRDGGAHVVCGERLDELVDRSAKAVSGGGRQLSVSAPRSEPRSVRQPLIGEELAVQRHEPFDSMCSRVSASVD